MRYYGGIHCLNLDNPAMNKDYKLASTYYDSSLVFFKIADYTNDPAWLSCAEAAERVYRDSYVMPSVGAVPGYWNFSHGLVQDYLRTGDDRSKRAAVMLSQNAAYAGDQTPLEWTRSADYSREVAYAIMSYLNAEDCGEARRARLTALVDQAFDHLDQWFVRQNAPYVRPFMVALTSQALITYHERTGDSRVLPALTRAADRLWDNTWLPHENAFMYTDREHSSGGREPAPDLNLLIAPLYGWLYHQTGEPRFAERGDQIFAGGVRDAFLDHGKQFNQSYRWSFEYVQWRSGR